jgi:hypothetical protein
LWVAVVPIVPLTIMEGGVRLLAEIFVIRGMSRDAVEARMSR